MAAPLYPGVGAWPHTPDSPELVTRLPQPNWYREGSMSFPPSQEHAPIPKVAVGVGASFGLSPRRAPLVLISTRTHAHPGKVMSGSAPVRVELGPRPPVPPEWS